MNLGMGAMLRMLGGNEDTVKDTVKAVENIIGKKITSLTLDSDDVLTIKTENGRDVKIFDDGQSCCESRYMRTDDNLDEFVGAEIREIELRNAAEDSKSSEDEDEDEYYDGAHEIQFLVIVTDKGNITFSNHNVHNGYYGGFGIRAQFAE